MWRLRLSLLVLALASSWASKLELSAKPDVLGADNPNDLTIRCSLTDSSTINFVTAMSIDKQDQVTGVNATLAMVTPYTTSYDSLDFEVMYNLDPTHSPSEKGFLQVTWANATQEQAGTYRCVAHAVNSLYQLETFIAETDVRALKKPPNASELWAVVMDLQKELADLKDKQERGLTAIGMAVDSQGNELDQVKTNLTESQKKLERRFTTTATAVENETNDLETATRNLTEIEAELERRFSVLEDVVGEQRNRLNQVDVNVTESEAQQNRRLTAVEADATELDRRLDVLEKNFHALEMNLTGREAAQERRFAAIERATENQENELNQVKQELKKLDSSGQVQQGQVVCQGQDKWVYFAKPYAKTPQVFITVPMHEEVRVLSVRVNGFLIHCRHSRQRVGWWSVDSH